MPLTLGTLWSAGSRKKSGTPITAELKIDEQFEAFALFGDESLFRGKDVSRDVCGSFEGRCKNCKKKKQSIAFSEIDSDR